MDTNGLGRDISEMKALLPNWENSSDASGYAVVPASNRNLPRRLRTRPINSRCFKNGHSEKINHAVQEPVGDRFSETKNQQLARSAVSVSCRFLVRESFTPTGSQAAPICRSLLS